MRIILGIIISVLIFASCDSKQYYDESISIPKSGWFKNDAATFAVDIDDSIKNFNLYLNIRNTTDYKWQNAYFFIQTQFPNNTISRDTVEVQLADHRGKWFGDGMGKIKDNRVLLRRNIRFPITGNYKFEIFQGMRKDTLHGINDIGIRIEEVQIEP